MCLFFFWKKNGKLFPLTLLVSSPSGPAPPFSFFFLPAQLLPAQPSPAGPAVSLDPFRPSPSPLTPTGRPHLPGPSSTSRSASAAVAGPRRAPLCPWAFSPPEPGHAPRFPGALPAHAPGRTHFSFVWLHRTRTRVRTGHELPCPRCARRGLTPRPYK